MPGIRITLGLVFILVLGLLWLRQPEPGVIEAYNTKNLIQLQKGGAVEEVEKTWELNPKISWLGQINLTTILCPTNEPGAFSFLARLFLYAHVPA